MDTPHVESVAGMSTPSMEPYMQRASDKREKNDEIAEAHPLILHVPQPRILDTPEEYYSNILELSRGVNIISSTANTLSPDFLLPVLKLLGMSYKIDEDRLTRMLLWSGYVDAYVQLDREHFILFDSDFKFLESFKAYIASSKKPGGSSDLGRSGAFKAYIASSKKPGVTSDLGRLGEFFKILEAARESGFKSSDFVNAFNALDMNITIADGYFLERYSTSADRQDFERFLSLNCYSPQDVQGRRIPVQVYFDRSLRVARMILFVSMYIRPK